MAVLMELAFPGVTAELYDTVDQRVGTRSAEPPAGLLFHTAIVSDAGLHVIDLWESQQAFSTFFERLQPVAKEVGFADPPEPPRFTEVHYHYER